MSEGHRAGSGTGPKTRKHFGFDENVNDSAAEVEAEATDIESDTPLDQNEPVEQNVPDPDLPPAFTE